VPQIVEPFSAELLVEDPRKCRKYLLRPVIASQGPAKYARRSETHGSAARVVAWFRPTGSTCVIRTGGTEAMLLPDSCSTSGTGTVYQRFAPG